MPPQIFSSFPSLAGGTAARWWEDNLVTSVQTPGDAVEFQVRGTDLQRWGDGEQVLPCLSVHEVPSMQPANARKEVAGTYEALDLILAAPNAVEVPVPQNLGATSDENLNRLNIHDSGSVQHAVDV
jgi:hypothetical protein